MRYFISVFWPSSAWLGPPGCQSTTFRPIKPRRVRWIPGAFACNHSKCSSWVVTRPPDLLSRRSKVFEYVPVMKLLPETYMYCGYSIPQSICRQPVAVYSETLYGISQSCRHLLAQQVIRSSLSRRAGVQPDVQKEWLQHGMIANGRCRCKAKSTIASVACAVLCMRANHNHHFTTEGTENHGSSLTPSGCSPTTIEHCLKTLCVSVAGTILASIRRYFPDNQESKLPLLFWCLFASMVSGPDARHTSSGSSLLPMSDISDPVACTVSIKPSCSKASPVVNIDYTAYTPAINQATD